MAEAAENECGRFRAPLPKGDGGSNPKRPRWSSVALVPFWGGSTAQSGGNSHSMAFDGMKMRQAAGTQA